MTDLQLALLLRQYHARLVGELAKLEERLPDDMKRERQVKNWLNPSKISAYAEYPALSGLEAWANDLETAAELLEQQGEPKENKS